MMLSHPRPSAWENSTATSPVDPVHSGGNTATTTALRMALSRDVLRAGTLRMEDVIWQNTSSLANVGSAATLASAATTLKNREVNASGRGSERQFCFMLLIDV